MRTWGTAGSCSSPTRPRGRAPRRSGFPLISVPPDDLDDAADVIVTDHHRAELGTVLRDMLATKARWIGVMGNPQARRPARARCSPSLGVPAEEIARVHRPIGLNIGSRTPPEIAISALAGLVADRNGRSGGFEF